MVHAGAGDVMPRARSASASATAGQRRSRVEGARFMGAWSRASREAGDSILLKHGPGRIANGGMIRAMVVRSLRERTCPCPLAERADHHGTRSLTVAART